MSDDGKMPEAQPSDHMEAQDASGLDGREANSTNSFNQQRAQPGGAGNGKTAFIAKKERQE